MSGSQQFSLLLKKFDNKILETLATSAKVKVSKKKKDDYVNALLSSSQNSGVNQFASEIKKDLLVSAFADAGIDTPSKSLKELSKLFIEKIEEKGIEALLKKMKMDTLKQFVSALEFETDASKKEELVMDISDEVLLLGARDLLQKLHLGDLKDCCKVLKLKSGGKKEELLDRVLNLAFPGILPEEEVKSTSTAADGTKKKKKGEKDKEANQKTKEEIIANRKSIRKGITQEDLFQDYWTDELKNFCKDKGVKASGKKPDLIKRILAYLENPEEKGFKPKAKRKRSSSSTKKQSSSKKQKTEKKDTTASNKEE